LDNKQMAIRKSMLGGLIAVLLFGIILCLVQIGYFARGKPLCAVCQRPLHKAVSFTLQSAKGRNMETCCPRCGLRYVVDGNGSPLWATNFSTGKKIPAKQAFYLEGSQIMECCASPTIRGEYGIVCEMHFDRCQPSLVTFSNYEEAQQYQAENGGHSISYEDALASVQRQMGR
jgi:hypothetical protein